MGAGGDRRLGDARDAFIATVRNADLRRAQLSFGLLWASEWAFQVALSVVAFDAGGTTAVGLVAALRLVPSAVLSPVGTALADRLPRDRILIAAGLLRALATGVAVVTLTAAAPIGFTYALAVIATAGFAVIRPAHSALLPALCSSPRELTGATVVRGFMDSAGTLLGPALAAAGLALGSPEVVFAAVAVASLIAAVLVARVRYEPPPRVVTARRNLLRESTEGFVTMVRSRDAGLVAVIAIAQGFTRGCFGVLVVVLAIDELGRGQAAVGWLTAAVGVGAVAGSIGAGMLADGRNLARWEGIGAVLWGLPLVACAAVPQFAPAFALFMLLGVGNALVDVGVFTLPVRLVPDELLGRYFGVLESIGGIVVGIGALLAPVAVDAFGVRGALVAAGVVPPVVVVLGWLRLTRIDRTMVQRDDVVRALRRVPMLHRLPVSAIERLAGRAQELELPDGAIMSEQGTTGDTYYVIADGRARVSQDGVWIRTLETGEGFGEIALLRSCERTATVAAEGGLSVYVVHRDDFLPAVTGYRPAASEAAAGVETLMAADAARA